MPQQPARRAKHNPYMSSLARHLLRFVAKRKTLVILPLIMLAAASSYSPGLHGPFVFDDQANITFNPDVAITDLKPKSLLRAALSNESGPLKRVLPALSFGVNHYMAGGFKDTFIYKVTNLLIHLANAGLVYWLSLLLLRQLARRNLPIPQQFQLWLPVLIAAAWALAPIQLTSVLYVVQRMSSLSALFVFAGLITFIYGRVRLQDARPHGYLLMTLGLMAGLLLGLMSKENAALLPLLAGVVELIFFERATATPAERKRLRLYYSSIILLPGAVLLVWLAFHPQTILGFYKWREFTLIERLLTEARVLWFYVGLILLPRIGAFGMYHDDIAISTGLLTPWTTLPAVLALIAIAVTAVAYYRRYPMFSFVVLWFLVAHSMESSFIALEIAHEHRNYVASFGIMMGCIYGLAMVSEKLRQPRVGITLLLCYVAVLGFVTFSRAHTWSSLDRVIETTARNHPRSASSQYMLAELYAQVKGDPLTAMRYYKRTADLDSTDAHALIKIMITASDTTINGYRSKVNSHPAVSVPGLPDFVSITKIDGRTTLLVNDAITSEIERRLREEVINPHTSFTLGLLSFCINRGEKTCGHLYGKAVSWYQLALHNPKASTRARGYLASGLARLYMEHGDYARALTAVTQSREYDPSNVDHWLQEAEVYLQLNQLERARHMIELTRKRFSPLDTAANTKAQDLLRRIDSRREKHGE
jgi:hypothetical protein